jgi:RyR domain
MSLATLKVVVAGDVCIDWLRWRVGAADHGPNWQLCEGASWAALPGGALLLAEMLRRLGGMDVRAPQVSELRITPPEVVLHSLGDLGLFAAEPKSDKKVYRIGSFGGYTGPADRQAAPPPRVADDDAGAGLVVLDDAGNVFGDSPDAWPAALTAPGADPLVLAKLARPLLSGGLWTHLRARDPERLVLVIDAGDLRAAGVNLSRQLSWERTAKDLVWQMACNPWLVPLANVRHLIVRFDLDAAIYYRSDPEGAHAVLVFDPSQVEGGFADSYGGGMQGCADAFVAALAKTLACTPDRPTADPTAVEDGIRAGLGAARQLLRLGYGTAGEVAAFPSPAIFADGADPGVFARVVIPGPTVTEPPDPTFWSILEDMPGVALEELAGDLVRQGKAETLGGVPVGQFGKLRTADRAEIEGFRSLRNLMKEYLAGTTSRPLSVAVFGTPGSGKSFSVTEVANDVAQSLAGGAEIGRLDFNLSQFRSPEDLCHAFHLVRDTALKGAMPLVFFDEFDSAFEGGELGWLKYFLAPMQDGKFREGEATHPIGRAIFVFAGGTRSSFAEFAGEQTETATEGTPGEQEAAERFKAVKGPDFVSRLRGYVNIAGPNPTGTGEVEYVVRRAILLRSLIERKARGLSDSRGNVRIDDGVLRALLRVPFYKHGARSMEAILDMSLLAGQTCWSADALPPADQLALQVDAEVFGRLVLRDVLLGASREVLGQAIHARYLADQKDTKSADDLAMQPWETLQEDLRESNRQQADDIAAKLHRIGCGMLPVRGRDPALITFTDEEVETMAEMEHARWMTERRLAGWVYDPERDVAQKRTPHLVPYAELSEDAKKWDRDSVRAIPQVLALAKFEVCRL